MKLGQVTRAGERGIVVIEDGKAYWVEPASGVSRTRELLESAPSGEALGSHARSLARAHGRVLGSESDLLEGLVPGVTLGKPVDPPEVWATGVTYRRQAVAHDTDLAEAGKPSLGLYAYVYSSYRAEVFFKGFDRTTRGPGETVGLRADSVQVLPEAELVAVLGVGGAAVAFTGGNDLTCWDLELESPLFLSQAKIYDGSCGLGPFLVPANEIDPYGITARCVVRRDGLPILESTGNTRDLKRSVEEMAHFLRFNNDVPPASVLFTGTTCVTPPGFALQDGDEILVDLEGIGRLANRAARWAPLPVGWTPRHPPPA